MKEPITTYELDKAVCAGGHKEEQVIYLHGRCHVESPSCVSYDKKRKVLVVECALCEAVIAVVRVANPPEEGEA